MKKYYLIIIPVILGLLSFTLTIMLNGKTNDDKNKEIKKEISFTGVYQLDDKEINIYLDDQWLYFSFDTTNYGRAMLEDGIYKGGKMISGGEINYSFTRVGDDLKIESDNTTVPSGLYKRKSDLTINEFFNNTFGNTETFNSKYNGLYKNNNNTLLMYSVSKTIVRVLLQSESSSVRLLLNVVDENHLEEKESGEINSITFKDNNTIVLKGYQNEEQIKDIFSGEFIKERSIEFKDVISNNLLYW